MRRVPGGLAPEEPATPAVPGKLLQRAPYLATIAVVVLASAASAAVLDFLFKAGAGATFGKGAPLLRFFAIFYTGTQFLTFLVQTTLPRPALQRFGIGRTISGLFWAAARTGTNIKASAGERSIGVGSLGR